MTASPAVSPWHDAIEHHIWANERLLDACATLTDEQLRANVPGTYGPILATLHHLIGTDGWYLSFFLEFENPITPQEAEEWLAAAPGVRLVNDALRNHFPMPNEASGGDDVLVGRIRADLSDPTGRTLSIFVVGDQLLKGAALNAVQIAEVVAG